MKNFNSAVILAGGQSTRMGFDKQLLKSDNRRLMDRLITQLERRFGEIMVSSSTPELYDQKNIRVIQDIYTDIGPLGGIHATLTQVTSAAVFVIACDMPFIELPYIDYMVSLLAEGNYDACVTSRQGYLEPFHAFYSRSVLPLLEEELAQGRYSVNCLLRKANAFIVPEETAASFLPGWRVFTNLNTPQEYEAFCRGEGYEAN